MSAKVKARDLIEGWPKGRSTTVSSDPFGRDNGFFWNVQVNRFSLADRLLFIDDMISAELHRKSQEQMTEIFRTCDSGSLRTGFPRWSVFIYCAKCNGSNTGKGVRLPDPAQRIYFKKKEAKAMLTMDSVIESSVIEQCRAAGACREGFAWISSETKTFQQLGDHNLDWLRWMAKNLNDPAVLEVLSKDADLYVRGSVAGNSNTPVAVLELLSKDAECDVRWSVADNSNTPVAVLELLSKDADADVRWSVAGNSNTPVAVLELLSKDAVELVRWSVAGNSNTPGAVLELLSKDADAAVRDCVFSRMDTSE